MANEELNSVLDAFGLDPVRIHRAQLDLLQKAHRGEIDIVDPTNPMIRLMELNAVTTAAWFRRDEEVLRKMYPNMAGSYNDLYRHMSNEDYIGRFATPATTAVFTLHFHESELIKKSVPVGNSGMRKLIIPRNTTIQMSEFIFTLQYPIEIRFMAHGSPRVVYDTEVVSPLQSLETNGLTWIITMVKDKRIMMIDVPMWQFSRVVYTDTVNSSTSFRKTYVLDDQFYHCRVYGLSADGTLNEYNTTHSEEVYDPKVPTVLLQVNETELTVEIPVIYFSTGLLNSRIQIEILTTKGKIRLDLGSYSSAAYVITWGDGFNNPGDSIYSAPLNTLEIAGTTSPTLVDSGADGIDFETLKQRVIDGATKISLPITDAQIRAKLSVLGYDVLLSVDDLSVKRNYLATKSLPAGAEGYFDSGASCSIDVLQTDIESLVALPTVSDNGTRVTIRPDTLYVYEDGIPKLVPVGQRPQDLADVTDQLLGILNSKRYAYSPFHYVLDTNYNTFDVRPYYLDSPSVVSRIFMDENDTTQLSVSTRKYLLEKDADGYTLTVASKVGVNYTALPLEQLFVQLRFKPHGEKDYAYINGEFSAIIDDDYHWKFRLASTFDIDENDRIVLTNFSAYEFSVLDYLTDLTTTFEIIYSVSDYSAPDMVGSYIDDDLGKHLLPEDVIGITKESVTLSLGYAMKSLWTAGRAVAGDLTYQTYAEDVPYVYDKTVYLRKDGGTGDIELTVGPGGELSYTVLHREGDPVLVDGEPTYRHRKGEIVYVDGNPVEITDRQTRYQVDIFLVDGLYMYANDIRDTTYKASIGPAVVGYLQQDLEALRPVLLENTRLYYTPKKTLGDIKVITEAEVATNIESTLSFEVRYFLTAENYANFELRASIEKTTSRIINQALRNTTVSVSSIIEKLKVELGDDVVAIDLGKLGPNRDLTAFTAIDDGYRCSVGRKIVELPDGKLSLEEDIKVGFVRHTAI